MQHNRMRRSPQRQVLNPLMRIALNAHCAISMTGMKRPKGSRNHRRVHHTNPHRSLPSSRSTVGEALKALETAGRGQQRIAEGHQPLVHLG
jgi:hypothetical protein